MDGEDEEGKAFQRGNVVSKDAEMEKPKAYIGTRDGPARERVEVYAEESGKFMRVLKQRVMWREQSFKEGESS